MLEDLFDNEENNKTENIFNSDKDYDSNNIFDTYINSNNNIINNPPTNKKKKFKSVYIAYLSLLIFTFLLIFMIIKLISWNKDNVNIKNETKTINDKIKITKNTSNKNTTNINPQIKYFLFKFVMISFNLLNLIFVIPYFIFLY